MIPTWITGKREMELHLNSVLNIYTEEIKLFVFTFYSNLC